MYLGFERSIPVWPRPMFPTYYRQVFQEQSFLWEERLWEIQNYLLRKRWENTAFLTVQSGCILCICSKVKMLNTQSVSPLTLRLKLEYCLTKKNEEIVETCTVLKILQIKIETTNTQLAMTSHLRSSIRQFLLDQNIWNNLNTQPLKTILCLFCKSYIKNGHALCRLCAQGYPR